MAQHNSKKLFIIVLYIIHFQLIKGMEKNDIIPTLKTHVFNPTDNYDDLTARTIQKEWTFVVYIAGDNNLYPFALQNLNSMKNAGSNEYINIVAQIDHRGSHTIPERLYIDQGEIIKYREQNKDLTHKLDFGQIDTLVDCMKWAVTYYPAKHYVLVLWNHGIGAVDSIITKIINPSELFTFNPATSLLELNRSTSFLEYFNDMDNESERGICFSDTFTSYITNQKLETALYRITSEILHKKIDILAFDACLMSMVEIASLAAPYVDIMVGSQEVELGTGWPYEPILSNFSFHDIAPEKFASKIVTSYENYYRSITQDFTQSAIRLNSMEQLEENIYDFVTLCKELFAQDATSTFKQLLKTARSAKLCTFFSEPSYIDLRHFYCNIQEGLHVISKKNILPQHTLSQLQYYIQEGINIIDTMIIKNASGKNLKKAYGISIYCPCYKIHNSYRTCQFALKTDWLSILTELLL